MSLRDKEVLTWEEEQQERPAVERLHPAPTSTIQSIPINTLTVQTEGQHTNAERREGNGERGELVKEGG